MYLKFAKRLLLEADKRHLLKVAWTMGWKGTRSVRKHKQRLKKGEYFPPFLYISVINSCNLRCQGCWVDVAAKQEIIDLAYRAQAPFTLAFDGHWRVLFPDADRDGGLRRTSVTPECFWDQGSSA